MISRTEPKVFCEQRASERPHIMNIQWVVILLLQGDCSGKWTQVKPHARVFAIFLLCLLGVLVVRAGAISTQAVLTQANTVYRTGTPMAQNLRQTTVTKTQGSAGTNGNDRPIALVYHDASTDCCSQALATLLEKDPRYKFKIIMVGPDQSMSVTEGLRIPGVTLYAQPGGDGDYRTAYRAERAWVSDIRNFVKRGGRYLGICMGAYLAASDAFNLFSGRVQQYIKTTGASTTSAKDTVIPILWRGKQRFMYFQDGAAFSGGSNTTMIATYTNGLGAAVTAPYGKGKVGVVGPHPEADQHWYITYNLTDPDGPDADLGYDFIEALMQ